MHVKTTLDEKFPEKLFRVVTGCRTPEQLRCADKYLKLAVQSGFVRSLDLTIGADGEIISEVRRARS